MTDVKATIDHVKQMAALRDSKKDKPLTLEEVAQKQVDTKSEFLTTDEKAGLKTGEKTTTAQKLNQAAQAMYYGATDFIERDH